MRTISLVNRLKWSFSGNMNPHALIIGDVDNDGDNEFVIGNLNGDLAVFKGECPLGLPTYVCRGLGTITCIAIGDVRNIGKNSIVCINAEGHAHIFDIPPQTRAAPDHPSAPASAQNIHQMTADEYLRHGRRSSDTSSVQTFRRMMANNAHGPGHLASTDELSQFRAAAADQAKVWHIHDLQKPNLTLKVPVNVNKILIADIDGDAHNELILARTDRILHAFQLARSDSIGRPAPAPVQKTTDSLSATSVSTSLSSSNTNSQQHPPGSSIHSSFSGLAPNKEKAKLVVKRGSLGDTKDVKSPVIRKGPSWNKSTRKETSDKEVKERNPPKADDKFVLLDRGMWVFDGQITSLSTTMHPEKPNEPILLIAQPGNTFTIIDCEGNRYNRDFTPQYSPHAHYATHQKNQITRQTTMRTTSSSLQSVEHALSEETKVADPVAETDDKDPKRKASPTDATMEDDMSTTPKASQSAFSNFKKATRTIRTLLQRSSTRSNASLPDELDSDNLTVECEEAGSGKIQDIMGDDITRTNYVVQNWPIIDGDDIVGEEESGAVATEIVIGKRHPTLSQSTDTSESDQTDEHDGSCVGMLSMDGKFTLYDLATKQASQRDLFVTHKLFSLATLDVSSNSTSQYALQKHHHHPLASPLSSPHVRQLSAFGRGDPSASPNGSKPENHSNLGSPAFSSSSRLSFVATNTSSGDGPTKFSGGKSTTATAVESVITVGTMDSSVSGRRNSIQTSESQAGIILNDVLAEASYDDASLSIAEHNRRDSHGSRISSGSHQSKETDTWSESDNDEEEDTPPESDLFVACAWNGVTYLIDWSKRVSQDEKEAGDNDEQPSSNAPPGQIKFQLVKFAFEGRVCAFTAGLFAVSPGHNVPCLFYVDFEDQIYVYYDVRISSEPVTGFIDTIDDDVEEALERIVDMDSEIRELAYEDDTKISQLNTTESDSEEGDVIDLGDGWKGIAEGDVMYDAGWMSKQDGEGDTGTFAGQLDLAEFIHECLYGFEDMKERLENQVVALEKKRMVHHGPVTMDKRRLSDLNITIESPHEKESEIEVDDNHSFSSSRVSSQFSEDDEEDEGEWMTEALLDSPVFRDNHVPL